MRDNAGIWHFGWNIAFFGQNWSFSEKSNYFPNSPYSASKASSDHFVRAYGKTYQMPYIISHCSNNYGQFQNKEKFIPTIINSIINKIFKYSYTRLYVFPEPADAFIILKWFLPKMLKF